jgi:hypothetical protein
LRVDPPELFRPDFFAPLDRVVGRFEALLPEALRADGRRAPEDFFRVLLLLDPRFAEPRLAPPFFAPLRFAPPRFAPPRFAPPFLAPLRLPALLPPRRAPPRDDLALVAMMIYPREGGAGRNRNFRAQADA